MSIYSNIVNYFRTRGIRFWVIITVVTISILLAFHYITTYSIASISLRYNDNIKETATLYSISSRRDDIKLTPLFNNVYLLQRDSVAIRALTDNYSTIKDLAGDESRSEITINLYKDKDATRYSGDNPGCSSYDITDDKLLSYNCTQPKTLVEYTQKTKNSAPQNNVIAPIAASDSVAYSVKPYQGGILGIRMPKFLANVPTNKFLFTIDNNGKIIDANTPDNLNQTQLGSANIVTDTASPDNTSFLITSKDNSKIFFAESVNSGVVTYKEYTLPSDFSSTFDTLICSLLQKTAYCFYGYSSGPPDSKEESRHHGNKKPATFITIDFSNESPVSKKYSSREAIAIDNLYITQAGNLYTLSGENLVRIDLSAEKATPSTYVSDVDSISSGKGLYYIRNNGVFRLDDEKNESYQVFYSQKLRLSEVISLNESVFVNAFTDANASQRISTYRINNETNETPGFRLIDTLPFAKGESNDISDMDFYKNNLYIRVKVNTQKTGRGAGVDLKEYEEAKKRITDLLQEKSIDLSKITVTLSY